MSRYLIAFAMLLFIFSPSQASESTLLQGNASYWRSFIAYWERQIVSQDGVVMTAILVGAVGIFIITRGKWIK
jgi:uncharacterized membrane protein YfcA